MIIRKTLVNFWNYFFFSVEISKPTQKKVMYHFWTAQYICLVIPQTSDQPSLVAKNDNVQKWPKFQFGTLSVFNWFWHLNKIISLTSSLGAKQNRSARCRKTKVLDLGYIVKNMNYLIFWGEGSFLKFLRSGSSCCEKNDITFQKKIKI